MKIFKRHLTFGDMGNENLPVLASVSLINNLNTNMSAESLYNHSTVGSPQRLLLNTVDLLFLVLSVNQHLPVSLRLGVQVSQGRDQ